MMESQLINITAELWGAAFCLMASISALSYGKIEKFTQKLVYLEVNNVLLLVFDVLANFYHGDTSTVGYYMVRISNFMVFALSYAMIITVSEYIFCYTGKEENFQKTWSKLMWGVFITEIVLLVINSFNHMFYYFDEQNIYHRGTWFVGSQVLAVIGAISFFVLLFQNKEKFSKIQITLFIISLMIPAVAIVVQIFAYGLALYNLAVTVSIMFQIFLFQIEKSNKLIKQEQALNDMKTNIVISQIQPHFLYNSLTTIYYLCDSDSQIAKRAIKDFSNYLRQNLDSLKINTPIPLEEELKHVENYLKLEKMRFKENLSIIYDIKSTDFTIPALSLQPLVENAIKHGIATKKDGGTVIISTNEDPNQYILTVWDDGVGFDTHKKWNDGRSHNGIENVKTRIRSMCNGDLLIESNPGVDTQVTITIPKK